MTAHRVGLPTVPPKLRHGGLFHCVACFDHSRALGLSRWEAMLIAARCQYVKVHL